MLCLSVITKGLGRYTLIKIRSLIAPGFVLREIAKPGVIKDRFLIRLYLE
jgi:hypothetical protein